MMTSAKPKSSYLKTISNLENLENFPKNQKSGLIDEKSSSKISNKIASMKKLFEKNTEKSESSASMSICGEPMGVKQYRQKTVRPNSTVRWINEQPGDVQNSKFDEMISFVMC